MSSTFCPCRLSVAVVFWSRRLRNSRRDEGHPYADRLGQRRQVQLVIEKQREDVVIDGQQTVLPLVVGAPVAGPSAVAVVRPPAQRAAFENRRRNGRHNLTQIEFRDGVLYLHQNGPTLVPFPGHLKEKTEHKEAVIAFNQCTTAMRMLPRLRRRLLDDGWKESMGSIHRYKADDVEAGFAVELISIMIDRPVFHIQNALFAPMQKKSDSRHQVLVYKILSFRSVGIEQWIVETTGCQYGLRQPLLPYPQYMADYGSKIVDTSSPWGPLTQFGDLDCFEEDAGLNKALGATGYSQAERQSREHFFKFVDKNGMTSKDLYGTTQRFGVTFHSYVSALMEHMRQTFV